MIEQVDNYLAEVENYAIQNQKELEEFRLKYLSKKGLINELFEVFKQVHPEK
jgi:phenylalanyl-tRNA synthetase alpha chain